MAQIIGGGFLPDRAYYSHVPGCARSGAPGGGRLTRCEACIDMDKALRERHMAISRQAHATRTEREQIDLDMIAILAEYEG